MYYDTPPFFPSLSAHKSFFCHAAIKGEGFTSAGDCHMTKTYTSILNLTHYLEFTKITIRLCNPISKLGRISFQYINHLAFKFVTYMKVYSATVYWECSKPTT